MIYFNLRCPSHQVYRLDDATALVCGKAILWGAFDSNEFLMPANLQTRIKENYAAHVANDFDPAINPIRKVPVVVTRHEAELHLDEFLPTRASDARR
jgi:hypothetical protein